MTRTGPVVNSSDFLLVIPWQAGQPVNITNPELLIQSTCYNIYIFESTILIQSWKLLMSGLGKQ